MGEIIQNIYHEKPAPYVARAFYNPDNGVFEKMVESSSFTILDVGCGYPPRLSWGLEKANQLWVGCDPVHPEHSPRITNNTFQINSIFRKLNKGKYAFYHSVFNDVPQFYPDVISVIAPNQEDIHNGKIFDDDLSRFLSPNKTQYLVAVLDKRTNEYYGYNSSALKNIDDWIKKYKFKVNDSGITFPCEFSANSADLGAKNTRILRVREPKGR